MPLTIPNDVSIHEAGHALIYYLMSDLVEVQSVTIDTEYSKSIDKHSDGGVLFKYLKHPKTLNLLELDQFCLSVIGGLAADLVNENNGEIADEYFFSNEFPIKVQHFHYQGDMFLFHQFFDKFQKALKVSPQQYIYISIKLITNFFSNPKVVKALIGVRDIIDQSKILDGKHLMDYLDHTYLGEWKFKHWQIIKEQRKNLFNTISKH